MKGELTEVGLFHVGLNSDGTINVQSLEGVAEWCKKHKRMICVELQECAAGSAPDERLEPGEVFRLY